MTNLFQRVFPFSVENTDWQAFNGNLIMYYGQEPIPISSEDDWAITAKNVSQIPSFVQYNIPDPEGFENWQDWAKEVTLIINGKSH